MAVATQHQTVRAGYKQTELGVIPEDWEVTQVKNVTRNHKQGFYTQDEYVANGVRLVRITDLMNPQLDYAAMPMLRISQSDFALYKIKPGDFLFARSGAIGRYGIVYEDVEAVFGSYIIRFTFDATKLVNEYFGFLYETESVLKQLLAITQGSSNININASNIKSLRIVRPPVPEQHTIARALVDVDALIASLDQLILKKRDLKQAAMQQLLTGRKRLPGFSGKWEVKPLREIVTADWGNTYITKASYQDFGYTAYSASGPDGFVSWFEHESPGVVISAIGAQCGKTWLAKEKWTPIKNTIWFEANNEAADIEFLFYLTNDPEFWPRSGQAQPFVSVSGVRNAVVTMPPTRVEQTAIAAILSDMDAELAELEARRDKAQAIKQGMMEQLLTGSIRLV